ncbi:MAG: ureidoglycolate lyase [Cyanobacteria bacterium SZAS LIN-2]|nr:ureidoglycolate lyase [Cyanobacteria bacterium SZAS LIN-3]MBS1996415.1 ureidoglycolate lyase [Cyanobacteria bacterium SZAS LIN-2]
MSRNIIQAKPITRGSYEPYGELIVADPSLPFKPANFGRAQRYNFLSDAKNLRPDTARLNVCVFRCSAWTEPQLEMKLLERHAFSTQIFMPMEAGRYITIVALGDSEPDIATIAAFVIEGPQGISYHPGTWHYPMTVLDHQLDMFCLVYEDGEAGDCEIKTLAAPLTVQI